MAILLTTIFWIIVVLVAGTLVVNGYMLVLMMRYPRLQRSNEVHTVKTEDGWNIQLYRRKGGQAPGEPVVFVHSLAANRLNFEVPPGLSIVDVLETEGYDCWLVELRCCDSAAPAEGRDIGDITFDDYLFKDLPAAIAYVREVTGHDKVHWVGHSMGGMLLYAYDIAFGSEHIASGITLGSPATFKGISYTPSPILFGLTKFAPKAVRTLLKAMTPFAKSLRPKFVGFPINWDNVHPDLDAQALFNMVEVVPPQVAHEFDEWMSTGNWKVKGGQLDLGSKLSDIDIPLLVICGKNDPFTPEPKMQQFVDALSSKDKQFLMLSKKNGHSADYGHADLAFGMRSTDEVYEPALEWIENHPASGARRKVSRKTAEEATPAAAETTTKAPAKKKSRPKKKTAAKKKAAAPKTPAKAAPKKKAPAKKKTAAKKKPVAKKKTPAKKKTAARKKSSSSKKKSSK